MTAPDDLARTLAEHQAYVPHYGNGWVACSCDADSEDDEGFDYNAHLASVVSRRDADLRTRIEKLADAWQELAERIGHPANHAMRAESVTTRAHVASLRAALDGDTREDAPAVGDDDGIGDAEWSIPRDSLGVRSRVPADTDTGRGQ